MIKNIYFEVFSITCIAASFIWNLFMSRHFWGDECILLYGEGLAYFKYEHKIFCKENNEAGSLQTFTREDITQARSILTVWTSALQRHCSAATFMCGLLLPVKPSGIVLTCWHRALLCKVIKMLLLL